MHAMLAAVRMFVEHRRYDHNLPRHTWASAIMCLFESAVLVPTMSLTVAMPMDLVRRIGRAAVHSAASPAGSNRFAALVDAAVVPN